MLRRILLVCGALSSLLYVVMNILGSIRFESYSITAHTVSELSAIGAPSRLLWIALGIPYDLLMIAFGLGVWLSADGKRALRVSGCLLIAYGLIGLPWMLLAPVHLRGQGATFSDTMHIVLTMVTVPLMMTAIGFGAAALGRRFRLYSVATIVLLLAFGVLTGMGAPKVAANLRTPMRGVYERIDIALFLLWVVVMAAALRRSGDKKRSTGLERSCNPPAREGRTERPR
jgi:hypothetical protein